MSGEKSVAVGQAVKAIKRALEHGTPFVRVGGEDGFLLCLRRRGQEIEDPDGHGVYEALSGGVFRRFRSAGPDGIGYRWMALGPCDEDFLTVALETDLEAMQEMVLKAIPPDMAFQSYRAQEAARRCRRPVEDAAFRP